MIIIIIYMVLGYWAVGETLWKNKTIVEFKFGAAFTQRLIWGTVLGWILIPAAVIRKIFHL